MKMFFLVAANEDFELRKIDIRAAFLQAKQLDREVFLKGPKDIKREGIIWKLKKPLYGLKDASRKFWFRVKNIFKELGFRKLDGYKEIYYMIGEEGDLEGMVSTHVDDFDLAGRKRFVNRITEEIGKALDVSTVESNCFRFTGIDVKKVKEGIEISMEDYAKSLEEIQIRDAKADEPLTREELKVFKKIVEKWNWLAANTRPDLAIYALELAKRQKKAVIKDLREVNRVLKRVREKKVEYCLQR